MHGDAAVFGVNFADGRIKAYPRLQPGRPSGPPAAIFACFVRGNPDYGYDAYLSGGEETVQDQARGLTWQRRDDGVQRTWSEALAYCQNLALAGTADWRLPNAKELQSLIDYSRAPAATDTAAIPPGFEASAVESYFWNSTTLLDGPPDLRASRAVYVAFGRARWVGWRSRPAPGTASSWTSTVRERSART